MPVISMIPGGAGKKQETVLWTNPNPGNSQSSPTLTFSQAVDTFDSFAIEYKERNTDSDTRKEYFDTATFSFTGSAIDKIFVGAHDQDNNRSYVRRINMSSPTSATVSEAYRMNNSGTANSYAIIVSVIGLK